MKKTFTAEQVTAIENEAYENGMKNGFYQSYEMFDRVINKLRNSLEDVWSIEQDDGFPANSNSLKINFAVKTLEYLEDMIEAETYERPDLR